MIDREGMAADSAKNLKEVVIVGIKDAPKRKPVTTFLDYVDYFWNGGVHGKYRYDTDGKPVGLAPITGSPDLVTPEGELKGINTVYKGVKTGLPYIGKAFDILKRYTKAERLLLKIEPLLNGIGEDSKLLRAVEQKVLEYQKTLGEVANKYNAFDPKRADYAEYMQKAEQWLQNNAPNWKELLGK